MLRLYISAIILLLASTVYGADYHVGPGQTYTTLAGINWSGLQAGDTVYIHYATYHEKFSVSGVGTEANPIRIIGVPDGSGNLPIIDGQNATTPASSDFIWQTPNLVQWDGLVFIFPNSVTTTSPEWIEIKNLEIRNAYKSYTFTAENGSSSSYEGFAAGIYIRTGRNILIENCKIHSNGQAVYVWTGSTSEPDAYDGLVQDVTLRGNHFYNNGNAGSYFEHQTYVEGVRTIIESNHYGAMRTGAEGSHLKDRGVGSIIRYNQFDTAPVGWVIDLVEPENSWDGIGSSNLYKQYHIYGNIFINDGNYDPVFFHWNEDHYMSRGRALQSGGKLLFYNNTLINVANSSDVSTITLFNTHYGGWECVSEQGHIDLRNNIFASIPRTEGQQPAQIQFSYCSTSYIDFGNNLVTSGWAAGTSHVTGSTNNIDITDADFGLTSDSDAHLVSGSPAISAAGTSAAEMTSNYLSLNLTPTYQYVDLSTETRTDIDDIGAFEFEGEAPASVPALSGCVLSGGTIR